MNKKTVLLSILLIFIGIALYAASMIMLPTEDMLVVPNGYTKLISMQMSEKHDGSEMYKLDIKEPSRYGFYVWTNAKEDKTIMLEGSNDTKIGLIAGKDKLSNPEFTLQPGSYTLKLTNDTQPGKLVVYFLKNTPAEK